MYFKKLEIFGFKSFGDKTILNFEPGITAIVGPNGCGKSNIFDAIRWVLGEQSVKELRGGAMEDVIFNGTVHKPALGFAEVSLTFSNESRTLPVEYNEVTIARRLFRSGESEYLLNKTAVRLKDILELLMGTGIGAEAYSLVQQGKVDLVVSSRPEDRRIIIDEASGITKYKSKKKEALNKLKDTENNLLRINDIITEVKRQIASIERQAKKAQRYKEKFERLKLMEVKFARYQLACYAQNKSDIGGALRRFKHNESELYDSLQSVSEQIDLESRKVDELEQIISETHAEHMKLENQMEMDRRQITFNEERVDNLRKSDFRLDEQHEQLKERCRQQQEKIENLKAMLNTLEETIGEKRSSCEQRRQNLDIIAGEIKGAKDTIKSDEEKILNMTTEEIGLKNELTEIMKEFQGALARKRRLDVECEKVMTEKDDVDNRLRSICEDIESCSSKIDDLKEQKENKVRSANELKSQQALVTQTIDDLEKRRLSLISQREFIEELRVQYQDMPDPVVDGRLLTTRPPSDINKGIIGKVKHVQEIEPLRVQAIKQNFQAFSVDTLYEVICETKFIELDPQLITVKIEELGRQIEVQTKERDILNGLIEEQENVIHSINSAIHEQEKVLSIYEAQKNDILEESSKLMEELDLIESEIREARDVMTKLKAKEDELNVRLHTIEQELQILRQDIKEQQDWIAVKTQEREQTTVTIAQLTTEIQSAKEKEESEKENLKLFEDDLVRGRDEIQKIESDHAVNDTSIKDLLKENDQIREKINELEQRRHALQEVLLTYANQKTALSETILGMKKKVKTLEAEIENEKNAVHDRNMKIQEIQFSEKSIKDRLWQSYKIDLDRVIVRPAKMEEGGYPLSSYDPEFARHSLAFWKGAPAVLVDDEQEDIFDAASAEPAIEELRNKCESFGTVNLVAIDEYEELRQRFEFLTKQQSDLLSAKDALHRTIQKINRTTKQMFMETFTKVSEEFRIYFRMLFGGGEAYLDLVDPDNVLESGIEIIAKPPGKKLQSISLLSGGEKTLAAIALIFGVFKVRPSPFCILDEIDAALDESNVGRFGYLLKDFAKIAQFIVITHNKRTISNADVMYGITMQESGISKIVSVKLADDEAESSREELAVEV